MLGYCPECEKLCSITPRAPKIPHPNNPKWMDYYTVAHEERDKDGNIILDEKGKPKWCIGAKKAII